MGNPNLSQERNNAINEMLISMVDGGEHGLTVADILVYYMNNELLQEERDMILEGIQKEE